jgi:hypothetical protein
MILDRDFYSVAELASMLGCNRGKQVETNLYNDIRKGVLKARPQYHPPSKRVVKTITQRDAKRYLKQHCVSATIEPSKNEPAQNHPALPNQLRAIAVAAVREYLKTVETDAQTEGLNVVIDALDIKPKNITAHLRAHLEAGERVGSLFKMPIYGAGKGKSGRARKAG